MHAAYFIHMYIYDLLYVIVIVYIYIDSRSIPQMVNSGELNNKKTSAQQQKQRTSQVGELIYSKQPTYHPAK